MVRLEHVHKRFTTKRQAVEAVNDVSLQVRTGEIYGIIGYSGAGKSTLVRCINMLEPPDSGKVYVDDVEMTSLSERQLRAQRARIGMIFQSFNLFASRTVRGNIAYPLQHRGIPKETIAAKVDEMLKLTGLEDKADAYPSQLSGGQKQRVAIARTLSTSPSLLLCDEATSALDPTTTHSILQLLKDLNKKLSITIIVITHEMKVIDQICDRVAVIDKSCIAEAGKVAEVFTNPQSDIARELVLPQERPVLDATTGGRKLRLIFNGENTQNPVISEMILACRVPINVLFADTKSIEGAAYGHMILELPNDEHEAEKVISWLQHSGLTWKEER